MTPAELRILDAFPPPPGETYGFGLMRDARVTAATLYPALDRWERVGLVESRYEEPGECDGWLPRRMYRLTGAGLRERFERRRAEGVGRSSLEKLGD